MFCILRLQRVGPPKNFERHPSYTAAILDLETKDVATVHGEPSFFARMSSPTRPYVIDKPYTVTRQRLLWER